MQTKTCLHCGGRGKIEIDVYEGNQIRKAIAVCPTCKGVGVVPSDKEDKNNDNEIFISL